MGDRFILEDETEVLFFLYIKQALRYLLHRGLKVTTEINM